MKSISRIFCINLFVFALPVIGLCDLLMATEKSFISDQGIEKSLLELDGFDAKGLLEELNDENCDYEKAHEQGLVDIKSLYEEKEKLKRRLEELEADSEEIDKTSVILRSMTKRLDVMVPGDGSVWERVDKLIEKIKKLREEQEFRDENTFKVHKAITVSVISSVLTSLVVGCGIKYFNS